MTIKATRAANGGARSVGVRDAKAQLSRLLQDVQRGHEWTITERGRPIARLVAIGREQMPLQERIRRLENEGALEPAPAHPLPLPLPLEFGLARRTLDADRRGGA